MIGLIGAMKVEMDQLMADIVSPVTTLVGIMEYITGTLYGKEAVLAVCGPGKVNAALCAQGMIIAFQPEWVLNLGVAGAVSDTLKVGDIVIGTGAVQHDMDTVPLGDPPGLISGLNLVTLPCDSVLQQRLGKAAEGLEGLHVVKGLIATGDQFINSSEKRQWIEETFHAMSCEMEGAAIAHACYMHGIPCGIIRSISDKADGESDMDYPQFTKLAARNSTRLVQALLKQ